ncbi:MAG: type II secretion system minor pseudopilin GspJ [Pseudomonadota bacterium]|nr:type II secretion system minor pseudopilin GspJ [Pseudomonadota bacterium]
MNARGFTLLELVVALSIFAVMAVMAYGGLNGVIDGRTQTLDTQARWETLQKAIAVMSHDIRQASIRPVRDELGDLQPALHAEHYTDSILAFTRDGWLNPLGQPRSSLQRVGYRVDSQTLYRLNYWYLDRAPDTVVQTTELLDGVRRFEVRLLDSEGRWRMDWPPPDADLDEMPRAMAFEMDLEGLGPLSRVFVLE